MRNRTRTSRRPPRTGPTGGQRAAQIALAAEVNGPSTCEADSGNLTDVTRGAGASPPEPRARGGGEFDLVVHGRRVMCGTASCPGRWRAERQDRRDRTARRRSAGRAGRGARRGRDPAAQPRGRPRAREQAGRASGEAPPRRAADGGRCDRHRRDMP
ncbi:hypothetical protein QJS66_10850 [Kocuria rhizophila]|nr:hypothetical protein QJS66_10850 [Kocuria rhizophila]